MTRSAYRQAIAHFERALLALAHQPEGRETLEQFVDIKISTRGALLALSELESALVHMRDALSAAQRLQDSARIALSFSGVSRVRPALSSTLPVLRALGAPEAW